MGRHEMNVYSSLFFKDIIDRDVSALKCLERTRPMLYVRVLTLSQMLPTVFNNEESVFLINETALFICLALTPRFLLTTYELYDVCQESYIDCFKPHYFDACFRFSSL